MIASLAAAACFLRSRASRPAAAALLRCGCCAKPQPPGAYLSYVSVGIFIFGMFFFLTVFMQTVWDAPP